MDEKKALEETDPKKKTARKGRQAARDKASKDKSKDEKSEDLETVVEQDTTPKTLQEKLLKWMEGRVYVVLMILVTVLALFMNDAVRLCLGSDAEIFHPRRITS